jgi:hypothetical protein
MESRRQQRRPRRGAWAWHVVARSLARQRTCLGRAISTRAFAMADQAIAIATWQLYLQKS